MTAPNSDLENIIASCITALETTPSDAGEPDSSAGMREKFFEFLVLILANLYGKTPIASPLMDRVTMLRVTHGMDDGDAGRLVGRTEDWMRLEGLLRQQDGQKAYFLTRASLAVLSTLTNSGTLGEVFEKVLKHYAKEPPAPSQRRETRILGAYFLMQLGRN
jgi:hypothetical protein